MQFFRLSPRCLTRHSRNTSKYAVRRADKPATTVQLLVVLKFVKLIGFITAELTSDRAVRCGSSPFVLIRRLTFMSANLIVFANYY